MQKLTANRTAGDTVNLTSIRTGTRTVELHAIAVSVVLVLALDSLWS